MLSLCYPQFRRILVGFSLVPPMSDGKESGLSPEMRFTESEQRLLQDVYESMIRRRETVRLHRCLLTVKGKDTATFDVANLLRDRD